MRIIRHPMGLLWAIALSVPFFFLWNWLAPIYAPSLPPLYLHLPFLHCVGLLVLGTILRLVLLP